MITSRLSSDILEEQFGPTSIDILHQDSAVRIIRTIAAKTGQVLELSLVRFLPSAAEAFPDIHRAVLSGQSIGKAFRAAGATFRREQQFACKQQLPPAIHAAFGNDQPATVVSVIIPAGDNAVPYARITETYTSAASWPHLSGKITPQAQTDLNLLAEHLTALAGHKQ